MNATSAASTSAAAAAAAVTPMEPFIDLNTLSNRWSTSNTHTTTTTSDKQSSISNIKKYNNNDSSTYYNGNIYHDRNNNNDSSTSNDEYMIDLEERIQSKFISNKYYILYQKLILNYAEINGKLSRFLIHILGQITSNILKSKIILCIHILCKINITNIIGMFNDYKLSYIIQKLLEPLALHTSLLSGTTQTSTSPVPVVPITYPILSCMSILLHIKEYSIYSIRIIRSELACICNANNDILSPTQNTLNSALNPRLNFSQGKKNKNKINLLLFENAIQYITTILSIISIHPLLRRIILCTIPLPTSNHLISIVSQALNFTTQVCI